MFRLNFHFLPSIFLYLFQCKFLHNNLPVEEYIYIYIYSVVEIVDLSLVVREKELTFLDGLTRPIYLVLNQTSLDNHFQYSI